MGTRAPAKPNPTSSCSLTSFVVESNRDVGTNESSISIIAVSLDSSGVDISRVGSPKDSMTFAYDVLYYLCRKRIP